MMRSISILLTIVLLVVINFSIWSYVNDPLQLKSWTKRTVGVAFDPRRKEYTQENKKFATEAEIDQDLSVLEDKVHAVRTYSVLNGMDKVPQLAAKHRLLAAVGAWIDGDLKKNQEEIDTLIRISNEYHPNIVRLLVGNEVIFHQYIPKEKLIEYIREVKNRTWLPVSTSETFDIWLKNPDLAKEVDFIGVHILPYWNGIDVDNAVDFILNTYHDVQKAYPNKPIVITEVGWPSDGPPFKHAIASRTNQAKFLREFLNRASDEKITYYIVEAFDQPWKMSMEGSSGAYWGMFNADREPKYPMSGVVLALPSWKNWAFTAAIFSAALMALFLFIRRSIKLPGILFFGLIANLAISTIFWTISIVAQQYQTNMTILFWILLVFMQAVAVLILLIETFEISDIIWDWRTARLFKPLAPESDFKYPKVSVHLPIYNEPPLMVRQTLEALSNVDYPNLEVLVIDNNTPDKAVWEPVKEDCERLGAKFRFFHLENWPGYKAGALNYALKQTSDDAEIIAIIDSDYVVSPDWIRNMVKYFDQPSVGFVQSPQDYRDRNLSLFKTFCYWEYAGFFNIGMVQRNEYNAIIQHGTMTMIRKSALIKVGGWAEWCITEDSELGLRLYEAGYDSVYCKVSFGQGLMPDTMSGYMSQRFRWVYGAVQIIKAHWRSFLPTHKSTLTTAQRYYFVSGWLPWFSDALALLFAGGSLLLTGLLFINPMHFEIPIDALLLPTIGLFTLKIVRNVWLYKVRVPCSLPLTFGAALSGLGLTHTVARGFWQGLFTSGKPFIRTPKQEKWGLLGSGLMMIKQELIMLVLLFAGIIGVFYQEQYDNLNGRLWMTVLFVQSIPYLASLICVLLSIAPSYRKRS